MTRKFFTSEHTSSQMEKHYAALRGFAGAQRVAMRKYTIPQSMTVEYLYGDHLGSTSITADSTGAKVSEMRYKPSPLRLPSGVLREGETRYAWTSGASTTPAYKLSSYTFTGQYSYMDDPTTGGVTEGFGLMFYNARWYDPALGRFAQADTIIPGGVQGWDRYTYTNNSPVNYTDPTGHDVDCSLVDSYCERRKPKADVDSSKVSDKPYDGTAVSGKMMYAFYRKLLIDRNGYLTIKQFVELVMAQEFQPYQKNNGELNFTPGSNFNEELLKQTTANWYWGLHKGETTVSAEGALNWIASFGSAGMAYRAGSLTSTKASGLARDVIDYVYSIPGIPRNDPTAPSTFGNLSMFPTEKLRTASQGTGNNQYIGVWPDQKDGNPAYILSACQVAYQNGDTKYVDQQC